MRKTIGTIFFILMLAAAISRATGHHEFTNKATIYAHRMATATAEARSK